MLAASAAGGAPSPHAYEPDARVSSWGEEAVALLAVRLGIEQARVLKTLVVGTGVRPDDLAVAVLAVPERLDLKAAAHALGVARVTLAAPADAERVTGHVVGAISPLGERRALPTVLDDTALSRPSLLVSGGRRGPELELEPADLVRLTGAVTARIAVSRGRC